MSCSITRHPFGLVFPRMTVLMRKRASDSLLHCGHFEFRVAMVEFSNRSSLYSSQQIFGLSDGILRILTLSIKSQHFKGSLAILFLKLMETNEWQISRSTQNRLKSQIQSRSVSDPPLSDIDFRNKMTTLNSQQTLVSKV